MLHVFVINHLTTLPSHSPGQNTDLEQILKFTSDSEFKINEEVLRKSKFSKVIV